MDSKAIYQKANTLVRQTGTRDAEKIAKAIEEIDDEMEVEIQYGGQPIYYYIISAE